MDIKETTEYEAHKLRRKEIMEIKEQKRAFREIIQERKTTEGKVPILPNPTEQTEETNPRTMGTKKFYVTMFNKQMETHE